MQKSFLQLDQSGWWVLLIIVVAVAITWFLYQKKKKPWTPQQNWVLAGIRFIAVFLVLFLLLEPLIRQQVSIEEPPIATILVDNSQSVVAYATDSVELKNQIATLKENLENQNFETRVYSFSSYDSMKFDESTTNLSNLMRKIEADMEGRNWVTNIVLTDGIYNEGSSPLYRQYEVPQFTIGLGDTIPPRDLNLSRVLYNKVTFIGNETPIRIEVNQKGYNNKTISVRLTEGSELIEEKQVRLDGSIKEVEFIIKSEVEGLRKLRVSTPLLEGEFVEQNNASQIFMEVIDGKQKVLIVANAPHPDIRAIRSLLEETENYHTDVYLPSIDNDVPQDIYDVVIYHGAFSGPLTYQPKENPGIWYILNNESSLNRMSNQMGFLNIQRQGSRPDKVTGSLNSNFSKFKLPEDQDILEDAPPLEVPFGEYSLSGPTEVLLFQRVGSVVTKKPLFSFFDDGSQKKAVLVGQNIWKWGLQEAAISGNSVFFRDIVSKTIQFLSVKNDSKQFRFQSRGNIFSDLQAPIFDAEVYNDIYERIYGNNISLTVTPEEGQPIVFEFVDSEFNSSFKIPPLNNGIYQYSATVKVGDKIFSDKGQFLVEQINKEFLNLEADHNLLKSISLKTDGEYFHFSEADQVLARVVDKDFRSIIRSSDSYHPLIENRWFLLIILLLFSTEWVLRKYWGGY